jgi:Mg-chelatase subunit ChlD
LLTSPDQDGKQLAEIGQVREPVDTEISGDEASITMVHAEGPHPHRAPRRRHPWWITVLVLLCLVILAGAVVAITRLQNGDSGAPQQASTPPCEQHVAVTVDPRLASVLKQATEDISPWTDPVDCLRIDVTSRASSITAAEIARPSGTGMSAPLPDLWIPDSSLWIARARSSGQGETRLSPGSVSVAASPLVIAMRRGIAERMGWPHRQPRWSRLLSQSEGQARLATADLDEDATGLLTVAALTSGSSGRSLASLSSRLSVPLLGDASPAQLVAAGDVDAMATSEQDVIVSNKTAADEHRIVAAYDPLLRGVRLDFPLVGLHPDNSTRSDLVAHAAQVVRRVLLDPATQELLAAAGLRSRSGELAGMYGEAQGVLAGHQTDVQIPSSAKVTSLLERWDAVGRRSRLLVVVDRSGSMAETLPGSRHTKSDLAQSSLRRVVQTSAPDSDMGLWAFTTGLQTGDTHVLVTTGPLDRRSHGEIRRAAMLDAVTTLDPKPGGGTPLYDAVLAGFRSAQQSFSYGRLNGVIVVTDGRNEDARSISLARLLDQLRLEFDGVRPVRIIAIAYGAHVDVATLRQITDVTGGRTYHALTARDVSTVFSRVLANL